MLDARGNPNAAGQEALTRWIANAGTNRDCWPDGLGYWVGMQIAKAYVDASDDKEAALQALLAFDDPAPILARAATRLEALRR